MGKVVGTTGSERHWIDNGTGSVLIPTQADSYFGTGSYVFPLNGGTSTQVLVDDGNGSLYWTNQSGAGGGGAPTDATYITLSLNGSLSAERILTAGSNISLQDQGANGSVQIHADVNDFSGSHNDTIEIQGGSPTEYYHLTNDGVGSLHNASTVSGSPLSVSGQEISIDKADTSTDGYLGSEDWTTFNNKSDFSGSHADLVDMPSADNSDHDDRYYTQTQLGSTGQNHTAGAELIGIPIISGATHTSLHESTNLFFSAGRATGGSVIDAGGETVDVESGTGFIKGTDDDAAELLSFNWSGSSGVVIPTDTRKYIGIKYNSGTPIVEIRDTENYDLDTEFTLASIVNEGGTLHILNNPWWVTDGVTNVTEKSRALGGYIARDRNVGGLIISVPGTRNIAVSTGVLWANLNEFTIPAIDTSTPKVASHSAVFDVDNGSSKGTITASAGTPYTVFSANDYIAITGTGDNDGTYKIESIAGGNIITFTTVIAGTDGTEAATEMYNTIEYYWYDAVAGTWEDEHVTQYSVALWNDFIDANPVPLSNNKYANVWVYAEADDTEVSLVYPQAEYVSAAGAEAESPPSSIPTHIKEHGILIGRIIIKEGVDAPVQVDSAFDTVFTASQAADHGNLSGLSDDDHTQYHLSDGTRSASGDWDMSQAKIYFRNTSTTNYAYIQGELGTKLHLINQTDATHYSKILLHQDDGIEISFGADTTEAFYPLSNGNGDLGKPTNKFDNLYLGGDLNDAGGNVLSVSEAKDAYDHSQDNTQAHTDYLINNGDDSTTGSLVATDFKATGSVTGVVGSFSEIYGNIQDTTFTNIIISGSAEIGSVVADYGSYVGEIEAGTFTGVNVTSGANPGHTHDGTSLSDIDISTDTNLAASTGITLTDDTLTTNDSEIVHDDLSGFVVNEHINWSADTGSHILTTGSVQAGSILGTYGSVTGEIEASTFTGANVTTGADPGHTHTAYVPVTLADAANDFIVASADDTFVKKSLAETGAILEGDIVHDNLQSVHQDVTSASSPTLDGTNFTGIPVAGTSLAAGTNITLATNTLNVDDAFLINDGDDTTTGTLTAGGFTSTGTSALTSITTSNNIKGETKAWDFTIMDPNSVYDIDTQIFIAWARANLTITKVQVECSIDPTAEINADLKHASDFLTLGDSTLINALNTTSGKLTDTTITTGAVAVGSAIYIQFDAQPEAALKQIHFHIEWDFD